jgi:hypothetical protein
MVVIAILRFLIICGLLTVLGSVAAIVVGLALLLLG